MSEQLPPTEQVPVFNPIYFEPPVTELTTTFLDANYLRFPISQSAQEVFSAGLSTLNDIVFSSTLAGNREILEVENIKFKLIVDGGAGQISFPDATIQNSAFTGAGALAGSYTEADITIDANGKITAISSGTSAIPTLEQVLGVGNTAGAYNIDMTSRNLLNTNQITFSDTTQQQSAYTGGGAYAGSYTEANITLDSDGKITAISSGTSAIPTLASVLSTGNSAGTTNIDMSSQNIQNTNEISFSGDATTQNSAFTGAGALAGSYTEANITIDANGKITAIANGSSVIPTNLTANSLSITGTAVNSGISNPINSGGYISMSGVGGRTTASSGSNYASGDSFQINLQPAITLSTSVNGIKFRLLFNFWDSSNFYQTNMDFVLFPTRFDWVSPPYAIYNINNKINGNGSYNYTDPTYAPYGRQYLTYNPSFNGVSGANGYIRGAANTLIMELYIPNNSYNWSGTLECLDSTYLNSVGSYAQMRVVST